MKPAFDVDRAEAGPAYIKILLSWILALGSLTLGQWALIAGIVASILASIFTILQIYVLWRDKVIRRRPRG